MRYRIEITETARKEVKSLPGNIRQRVRRVINSLANNPLPRQAKELRNMPGRYRIRLDDWRIIYRVEREKVLILILRVRRKTGPETYEGIES
jgi:mRNA interferase RelE/StbE